MAAPRKLRSAVQTTVDPAVFDIAGFISGFVPAVVPVKLFRRGDLQGKLTVLRDRINAADSAERVESSIADEDPVTAMVAEYNAVLEEYEADYELFEFHPQISNQHKAVVAEWEASPHKDDNEYLTLMLMASACVSHPGITADTFKAMLEKLGDLAMVPLIQGFVAGYGGGGEPTAPFLPKSLPAHGGDGSSNLSELPVNGVTLP